MNTYKLTAFATATLLMVGCSTTNSTSADDSSSSTTANTSSSTASSSSMVALNRQDTVHVDYKGSAPLATYFRISDGKKTLVAFDAWDIAISTTNGAIIANGGLYGTNVRVFKTSASDLALDQSAFKDSVTQYSDSISDPFDAESARSPVYLIKDAAGTYYKVIFASINATTHQYSIEFVSGLNGTTVTTISGELAVAMDRVYLDLSQGKDVSALLPKKNEWDILFTRALEFSMGPMGTGATSAILLNSEAGVDVGVVAKPFDEVLSAQGVDFTSGTEALGASWYKSNYDPASHISTVTVPVQTFVLRNNELNEVKIQLLTFYGPENQSFYTVLRSGMLK